MQKALARTKLLGHRLPSWLPAALAPPQWVPSAQLLTKLPSRAHPSRCGRAGAVYDSTLLCLAKDPDGGNIPAEVSLAL